MAETTPKHAADEKSYLPISKSVNKTRQIFVHHFINILFNSIIFQLEFPITLVEIFKKLDDDL